MKPRTAIATSLAAAVLFGASTPMASRLASDLPPLMLAALLYLGSGAGLGAIRLLRHRGARTATGVGPRDWPWLAGSIVAGGMLAPVLLMIGLVRTQAAQASLLLNLEPAFTALLAWTVFREHAGGRLILGMVLIVAGGMVLGGGHAGVNVWIALACLCWAIDNNLTRRISHADALFVAALKGSVAGATNLLLSLSIGQALPPAALLGTTMLVGLFGYGVSLVLFIIALRELGAARAGAYFATAPFIGAGIAVLWLHSPASPAFWVAATLMAVGVWLHISEDHEHEHQHETLAHRHAHTHDAHHQHAHPAGWHGEEPHVHEHEHARLRHRHAHFPDLHHRHDHEAHDHEV
jgi:drug/metabolite transporter (DMT)-like permease